MTQELTEKETVIRLLNDLKSIVKENPNLKYYRNKDLKRIFGFSDNTIVNYRDLNIIPFTKIGEIYFYPTKEIDLLMSNNSNYMFFKNLKNQT